MNSVHFPGRILDRNVGGNSTYTRAIADGLIQRGWRVESMPASTRPWATAASETLYGRRRIRDAVLHYSADTGPLFTTRTPSVVTVHGVASRWTRVARGRVQETVWRTRVLRAIESCGRVITVSNSSADDVASVFGVERGRLAVIPHGVDVDYFADPTPLSPGLEVVLPSRFALFVGNIEPRKNVASLARAFAKQTVPLVVAGRPAWNFDDTLKTLESSPNVIYLGFVSADDRRALMQRCTLFVFPSLYEGFGFPILEAMAAGAPVLCSSAGSLAEVAGPAKRLVGLEPESIASDVQATLADDTWLSTAPQSGKEWAGRFSWETSVSAHIDVYQRLLDHA